MVGNQAYGAMSFTELGLAVPAGGSGPGAALIDDAHRQMQGAGRASELFGGSPAAAPPAVPALTTVTLDIEFTDPAGRTESVRRAFIDRLGPAARAAGGVGRAPLAPIALTNGLPVALGALYRVRDHGGTAERPSHRGADGPGSAGGSVVRLAATGRRRGSCESRACRARRESHFRHARCCRRGGTSPVARAPPRIQADTAQPIFYEAGPRLAIADFDPVSAAFALDLRRNTLRVAASAMDGPALVRANLARGLLDGIIESAIVEEVQAGTPRAATMSTAAVLDAARAAGIPLRPIRDPGAIGSLNVAESVRPLVLQSLSGHIVVGPERQVPVGAALRFAWWQIHPATGETVGVIDTGLHGAQAVGEDSAVKATVSTPGATAIAGPDGADILGMAVRDYIESAQYTLPRKTRPMPRCFCKARSSSRSSSP